MEEEVARAAIRNSVASSSSSYRSAYSSSHRRDQFGSDHSMRSSKDFAGFLYAYYVVRHGSRDAAEMDLLDLFASLNVHASSSARVRLFSRILDNTFQHRKIALKRPSATEEAIAEQDDERNDEEGADGSSPSSSSSGPYSSYFSSSSSSSTSMSPPSHSILSPQALALLRSDRLRASRVLFSLSHSERLAAELRWSASMSLTGVRDLSGRVGEMVVEMMKFVKEDVDGDVTAAFRHKHARSLNPSPSSSPTPTRIPRQLLRGPFQALSDDHSGTMWVDLHDWMCLAHALLSKFPERLREQTLAKMRKMAGERKRKQVLGGSGTKGTTTHDDVGRASHVTDGLQKAQQNALHPLRAATTAIAASLSSPITSSNRTDQLPGDSKEAAEEEEVGHFVDLDSMIEIFVESYIEEDARLHYQLFELFLQLDPTNMAQSILSDRKMNGDDEHKDGPMPSTARSRLRSARPVRHAASLISPSASPMPSSTSVDASSGEVSVDPELATFGHFLSVLRALGCSWHEGRLLELYVCACSRASYRQVQIEDLVLVARGSAAVLEVLIDWDAGRSQARRRVHEEEEQEEHMRRAVKANQSVGGNTADASSIGVDADEPDLPPLNEDDHLRHSSNPSTDPSMSNDEAKQEYTLEIERLKDRMREMDLMSSQRLDQLHRRHEKELVVLRQAHEREMAAMAQAQQIQYESNKRLLESERSRAASELQSITDSLQAQVASLQHQLQQVQEEAKKNADAQSERSEQRLTEFETLIASLEEKLAHQSDKYERKKEELMHAQQRIAELETAAAAAAAAVAATGNLAPTTATAQQPTPNSHGQETRVNPEMQ